MAVARGVGSDNQRRRQRSGCLEGVDNGDVEGGMWKGDGQSHWPRRRQGKQIATSAGRVSISLKEWKKLKRNSSVSKANKTTEQGVCICRGATIMGRIGGDGPRWRMGGPDEAMDLFGTSGLEKDGNRGQGRKKEKRKRRVETGTD